MRIVSLCPSLTELVFDLGRGPDVVGCTRYCVRPVEGVRHLPRLGGTKTPRIDEILGLAPDVVLLNEEENRREDAERLVAAGIRCLSHFPRTVAETAAMVRSIGRALERQEAGEEIAGRIEFAAARARSRARGAEEVSWAYLIWRKPWMSVGEDTYVSSLLSLAGGRNAFGGLAAERSLRYPPVTTAELAAAAPRAVLLASEPFPFADRHLRELAAATGLPHHRFHLVDGQALSWHGSHTVHGIGYAIDLLEMLRATPAARDGNGPAQRPM